MIRVARSMTSRSSSLTRSSRVAQLATAQLLELVEGRRSRRRDGHADLAAVVRIVRPGQQAELHETFDRAAGRGDGDPEPLRDLRHAELAGRGDDVQELGLGHRDIERRELRRVQRHQPVLEGIDRGQGTDKRRAVGVLASVRPYSSVVQYCSVVPNCMLPLGSGQACWSTPNCSFGCVQRRRGVTL